MTTAIDGPGGSNANSGEGLSGLFTNGVLISADGVTVVFNSYATNLVPGDYNAFSDAFAYRRSTGNTIRGRVFIDSNGNGAADAGEPGLAGVTVFLDANGNGLLDNNETSTGTDALGRYTFSNLALAEYAVTVVVPSGYTPTRPAVPAAYVVPIVLDKTEVDGRDFGLFKPVAISGTVFQDLNGNGRLDSGETGLADVTVQLNSEGAGSVTTTTNASGQYTFAKVGPGAYSVSLPVAPAGFIPTVPSGTDRYAIATASGQDVAALDFGHTLPPVLSFAGLPYVEHQPYTDLTVTSAASPAPVAGQPMTLTITVTNNGPNTSSPAQLTNTLPAGVALGSVVASRGQVTQTIDSVTVALGALAPNEQATLTLTVTPAAAGLFRNTASVTDGTDDLNPWDNTSPLDITVAAVPVDTTAPTSAITFPTATTYTATTWTGAITGTAADDIGGSGVKDVGVRIVDQASGLYWNGTQFIAGTPVFVAPSGTTSWSLPLPGAELLVGHNYTVTSLATDNAGNVQMTDSTATWTFAAPPSTVGTISGLVCVDANVSGGWDEGEPASAGLVVYLDANHNGQLDPGEATTTTDGNGWYRFPDLAADTYSVRVSAPYTLATSPRDGTNVVKLAAGEQQRTDFGLVPLCAGLPVAVPQPIYWPPTDPAEPDADVRAYIRGLYHSVLNRDAEPSNDTVLWWVNVFNTVRTNPEELGLPASTDPYLNVARRFWESEEHRWRQVESYYHNFLGRDLDLTNAAHRSDREYWANQFLFVKAHEDDVVRGFLTSPEYLFKHRGDTTLAGVLNHDLLAGKATASHWQQWTGDLAALDARRAVLRDQVFATPEDYKAQLGADAAALEDPTTEQGVLTDMLYSDEYAKRALDSFYIAFIRRLNAPAEEAWWRSTRGESEYAVDLGTAAAMMLASPQYRSNAVGGVR